MFWVKVFFNYISFYLFSSPVENKRRWNLIIFIASREYRWCDYVFLVVFPSVFIFNFQILFYRTFGIVMEKAFSLERSPQCCNQSNWKKRKQNTCNIYNIQQSWKILQSKILNFRHFTMYAEQRIDRGFDLVTTDMEK